MLFFKVLIPIVLFTLGVVFASFGNVLIYRYPNWGSMKDTPNSYCPNCKHRLAWYDLFPIFSYIFLGGKCRYCHEKISPRYIIVEISGGLIFLITYFLYVYVYYDGEGFLLNALTISNTFCYGVTLYILLLAAFIDYRTKEVPLSFTFTILGLSIVHWAINFIVTGDYSLINVLGLVVPLGLLLLVYLLCVLLIKVEPIGLADVILYSSVGLLLGIFHLLFLVLVSTVVCSIVELIKIKKTGKKEPFPMVPYIFLGTVTSVFVGEIVINFYLSFIGV